MVFKCRWIHKWHWVPAYRTHTFHRRCTEYGDVHLTLCTWDRILRSLHPTGCGAQVCRKTSKCTSAFPRGWEIKDRLKELQDLERERDTNTVQKWFEGGLIFLLPYFFSLPSGRFGLCESDRCPGDVLWQLKMVSSKSKKWHEQISRRLTCKGGWKGLLLGMV